MSTIIRNARIISPGVDLADASIEMEAGRITRVGVSEPDPVKADRGFNAHGMLALPGFIDIHVHGALGRDITDGTLEAVETIARAKLEEGVTTFCPTTMTLPEDSGYRLDRDHSPGLFGAASTL